MYFLNLDDGFIEAPFASPSINVYTLGCIHNCIGCHAPDLHNLNHPNRQLLTFDLLKKKINTIPGFYKSICWLGGDPFYQFDDCYKISNLIKENFPEIVNIVYTGYKWDEFYELNNKKYYNNSMPFDYIIDGRWNGKMLGQEGCNQKIWVKDKLMSSSFNYKEITYDEFKKGCINE